MIFKNNATVLNKLSVSYLMVVLIGSFLTGVTADIILENFFDRQIVDYNSAVVNTLRDYISKDIIDGVDRAYLKVISQSNNNEFFVDSFYQSDMDYKTIKNIMNHITDVAVEENEWLDGIYTYFSDSGVLVSTDGLIYKRGNRSNSLPEWMKSIIEADSEIIYVPTQPYDGIDILEDDNICMIVKPYSAPGCRSYIL